MVIFEKTLNDQIMATDLYVCLCKGNSSQSELELDYLNIVQTLKTFEKKYSRFLKNNLLDNFNKSKTFKLDPEFYDILQKCQEYYLKTDGIFDPVILNDLLNEGYTLSKNKGFTSLENPKNSVEKNLTNFTEIALDKKSMTAKKPLHLKIDLGGIGKSYIIQKISKQLQKKYDDFVINLGGDMYVKGFDQKNNYDYWAIEVDIPVKIKNKNDQDILLLLSDKAVATSGVYKRTWIKEGIKKNHLIDPTKHKSVDNDLISVTVVSDDVISADIYAKTILILGQKNGFQFCQKYKIPAILINKSSKIYYTGEIKKYLWNEHEKI